jgi:hypothetical protein
MKATTRRRIEALYAAIHATTMPPIALVDLTRDPDALAAYWDGDDSTMPPVPDGVEPGVIWGIVIAPTLTAFDGYRATAGMDEDDVETYDRAREQEDEDRQERAADREREHFDRVRAAADAARTVPELPANAYNPDWD